MIYDLIIIGGGPAGSSAALFARKANLKTLLIEKDKFPRDKICGDALSGKTVATLRKLNLLDSMGPLPKYEAKGVIFSAPNGNSVPITFRSSLSEHTGLSGYVCKRFDFDNFLFERARQNSEETIENFTPTNIFRDAEGIMHLLGRENGSTEEREFMGRMIIGADGYKSFVARQLGFYSHESAHMLVALRAYYENVSEMTDFIEIHFVKESLPGYFWIFPLPENLANVGIGMRHQDIKKRNIDLQDTLQKVIDSPTFAPRFKQAKLTQKIKGWNLPTGSIFRPNFHDGILLIGDAAGLVDPFTGEGIGNAMASAELAVEIVKDAIVQGDTSRNFLKAYDAKLRNMLSGELKLSYQLQTIGRRFPFLLNLVINKASKNNKIADWISLMIADENAKEELTSMFTYVKLLWA